MKRIFRFACVLATVCLLALGVFALATKKSSAPQDTGDVIIIKGGSIEVQCGGRHAKDCLGTADANGKYKRGGVDNKHIMLVEVKSLDGTRLFCSQDFSVANQPRIEITYK